MNYSFVIEITSSISRGFCKTCTYFNNVSSNPDLIIQQCVTGAKHVKSSKNGFPKARPWSKWTGKVSLSKILKWKKQKHKWIFAYKFCNIHNINLHKTNSECFVTEKLNLITF